MNDPKLVLDKLETLVKLSRSANTEYEKASLFGAISTIINIIASENEEYGFGLSESIVRIRWYSGAILGYDVTNGYSVEEHYAWFLGSLNVIREKFVN